MVFPSYAMNRITYAFAIRDVGMRYQLLPIPVRASRNLLPTAVQVNALLLGEVPPRHDSAQAMWAVNPIKVPATDGGIMDRLDYIGG